MPESVRSLVQRKIDALDDDDRRLLGAASVQGIDFDTAILAAVLAWSEEVDRGPAGTARARARARPVRGRMGNAGPAADAAVPLRAPHLPQRVRRVAARDPPGGAEPRGRGAADRADRPRSPATAPATSPCCSNRRATGSARRNTGTRRRRPPRACTRTTRRRGSRNAGWRSSTARPSLHQRAAAELALQMTYGSVGEDQPGLRRAGGRPRVRAGARAVPSGRRSAPRGAGPHRPVRAPHRLGGDHDVARRRARDAGPVQPARRSEPADDRPVVARRRVVSPRGARGRARAPAARRSSSTIRRFTRRASGRPASSRESSAAASSRGR